MSGSELSRIVKLRQIRQEPLMIEATDAERAALAERFTVSDVVSLTASAVLTPDGTRVTATGRFQADIVQQCAISGDDFPVHIDEPLSLVFVPEHSLPTTPDQEVELTAEELDEIPYEGDAFDVGEAIAQSLGLAIDPYATGPNAETGRKKAGLLDESRAGPFAALAALKKS